MRQIFGLLTVLSLAAPAWAAEKNIVETATTAPQFQTLSAAISAAGLADALKGKGPFTVLAPTDAAFAKLPAGTLDDLLKPENKSKLAAILKYHVIPGQALATDVVKLDGQGVKTLEGSSVPVHVDGQAVMVGEANVTKTDIRCSNGVIHVIDRVLLPPGE